LKKTTATLCLALLLSACTQSGKLAPVYSYGVKSGVGSLGVHTLQKGDTVWTEPKQGNQRPDVTSDLRNSLPRCVSASLRLFN